MIQALKAALEASLEALRLKFEELKALLAAQGVDVSAFDNIMEERLVPMSEEATQAQTAPQINRLWTLRDMPRFSSRKGAFTNKATLV